MLSGWLRTCLDLLFKFDVLNFLNLSFLHFVVVVVVAVLVVVFR